MKCRNFYQHEEVQDAGDTFYASLNKVASQGDQINAVANNLIESEWNWNYVYDELIFLLQV